MVIIFAIICVVCLGLYVYLGARQRAVRADELAQRAESDRVKRLIDDVDQLKDSIEAARRKLVKP